MRKQDVLDRFGGAAAVAAALGITRSAVYQWGDEVPLLSALHIERLTNGELTTGNLPMPGEAMRRCAEGSRSA